MKMFIIKIDICYYSCSIRIWSNPFGAPGRKKPPNLPDRAANTLIQSNTAQSKCNNNESNLTL